MTLQMLRPVSTRSSHRAAPAVRPSPVSVVQPLSPLEGYPVFGRLFAKHHFIKPSATRAVQWWLAERGEYGIPWPVLWSGLRKSAAKLGWSQTYWAMNLPVPSRQLPAGNVVFSAQKLLAQLTEFANPAMRQKVNGALTTAIHELPRHPIFYLKPMFDDDGQLLTHEALLEEQALQHERFWADYQDNARARQRELRRRREAARIRLQELQLARAIEQARMRSFDPVLVAMDPTWRRTLSAGTPPAAHLIIHWD